MYIFTLGHAVQSRHVSSTDIFGNDGEAERFERFKTRTRTPTPIVAVVEQPEISHGYDSAANLDWHLLLYGDQQQFAVDRWITEFTVCGRGKCCFFSKFEVEDAFLPCRPWSWAIRRYQRWVQWAP